MRNFFKILAAVSALSLFLGPASAQSESCETAQSYTVAPGDFLIRIARSVYGDSGKWTLIYNANRETIGDNENLIFIGDVFRIPCISDIGVDEGSTPIGPGADVRLLTANDYRPFTDESLLNDGLVTNVVDRVFATTTGPDHGIGWVDDWSRHLQPLLSNGEYDMGFPWLKPDCRNDAQNLRCTDFLFSDPMFEMLVLLFTHVDRPMRFDADEDVVGKVLCRPAGYYTHDLDKNGRNWLRDGKVELVQPKSVADCFRRLSTGEVDAVALNEFTGRSEIKALGLEEQVTIVDGRPLSIEGLHLVVSRNNPRAEALIERANEGLRALQDSGEYNRIVDQHLARFWAEIES